MKKRSLQTARQLQRSLSPRTRQNAFMWKKFVSRERAEREREKNEKSFPFHTDGMPRTQSGISGRRATEPPMRPQSRTSTKRALSSRSPLPRALSSLGEMHRGVPTLNDLPLRSSFPRQVRAKPQDSLPRGRDRVTGFAI